MHQFSNLREKLREPAFIVILTTFSQFSLVFGVHLFLNSHYFPYYSSNRSSNWTPTPFNRQLHAIKPSFAAVSLLFLKLMEYTTDNLTKTISQTFWPQLLLLVEIISNWSLCRVIERALALMIFLTARQCTIPRDPGAVTGVIKSQDGGKNRKRKVGERASSSWRRNLAAQFQAALWMQISDWAERTICIILPNWQAAGSQHGLCVLMRTEHER